MLRGTAGGPGTDASTRARDRAHWTKVIARLDPHEEFEEIYRILAAHEFPWDLNQSLSFALFRTYAVPSIASSASA